MAEGVDTPTAILAHAAAALRENPFDDISYRTLGDAVGVSERTVYRHFPTRSHLLEGVAECAVRDVVERVLAQSRGGIRGTTARCEAGAC